MSNVPGERATTKLAPVRSRPGTADGPGEVRLPSARRVAVFGGVYSNHLALGAALEDARSQGVDAVLCLGDLGAFGPHPDRVFPLLREHGVQVIRGNYDDSIARGLDDCQCGYTDERDNHFARLSYRYTFANTSPRNRRWMGGLPHRFRFRLGDREALAVHGSPRRMNEFLWESTTPTHFLEKLMADEGCDLLLGTHTGIHWQRTTPAGRTYVNVGALGRPPNDGRTTVWYALIDAREGELTTNFRAVSYDFEGLAREMAAEGTRPSSSRRSGQAGGRLAWKSCQPGSGCAAGSDRGRVSPNPPAAAPRRSFV